MTLTKERLKQKKYQLAIQEMYRLIKTGQSITEQNLQQLQAFDQEVGLTAAIHMRISAFEELQVLEQQRVLEVELRQFIQVTTQNDTEKSHLISKEYEELALLLSISQDEGKKAVPTGHQVKEYEDGHSRQPMQVIELLETR